MIMKSEPSALPYLAWFELEGNASVAPQENGFMDSLSLLNSEKAVQELIQEPHVNGIDDHLIEFSEAMRTVAKALRRAAEGKASAQAEAAEWKRKYELERARNLQFEHEVLSSGEHSGDFDDGRAENLGDQLLLLNEAGEQSERCCGKHGICSHEVLRDGESDSNPIQNKIVRKASFKLSWCCKGEKSDQHRHDVVSFEKGNITTAERSSNQISLKWESPPQTVLILTKPNSTSVQVLCTEMIR
ncbi:unnamed protein product [Ilex paraguariensis]|uniref:NAD(H) kinase 1 n=1 Tax=Ilex paraguariensis TaxID=185542 RepID=A0ABC8UQX5_9AQUA